MDSHIKLHITSFLIQQVSSCFYKSSLRLLSWSEILKATSQEDVILLLCAVELVSLAPVVGHGVGEDLSVLVKCGLGDGLLAGLAGLQLGPRVLVPEGVLPITAHCCQGPVHRVECDVIHSKYVLQIELLIHVISGPVYRDKKYRIIKKNFESCSKIRDSLLVILFIKVASKYYFYT